MALYFSDQYVHVNGEDIKVPSHIINKVGYLNIQNNNGKIYVNGYKYNKKNKTWNKSFIGRYKMTKDEISKLQIIIGIIMTIALIAIFN